MVLQLVQMNIYKGNIRLTSREKMKSIPKGALRKWGLEDAKCEEIPLKVLLENV